MSVTGILSNMPCTSLGSVSESARTWYNRVGTPDALRPLPRDPLLEPDARAQAHVGVELLEVGGQAHGAEAALDDQPGRDRLR